MFVIVFVFGTAYFNTDGWVAGTNNRKTLSPIGDCGTTIPDRSVAELRDVLGILRLMLRSRLYFTWPCITVSVVLYFALYYGLGCTYFALYYRLGCTLLRPVLGSQQYFTWPYITVSFVLYFAFRTVSVPLACTLLEHFLLHTGGWPPITHKAIILPTTLQCI